MKRSGGSRSSSRSTTSTSDADGLVELIFYLAWILIEISMFFRYAIFGGLGYLIIYLILPNPVNLATAGAVITRGILYIALAAWAGFSLYGLYLDILDYTSYTTFRVKGQDPRHLDVDVRAIPGIGPKRVAKLNSISIYTLADLSRADPDRIAQTGISRKLALKFIA